MTKDAMYCWESDVMPDVALNITHNEVSRFLVLNKDERLVGIVSLGNLAMHSRDHLICGKFGVRLWRQNKSSHCLKASKKPLKSVFLE